MVYFHKIIILNNLTTQGFIPDGEDTIEIRPGRPRLHPKSSSEETVEFDGTPYIFSPEEQKEKDKELETRILLDIEDKRRRKQGKSGKKKKRRKLAYEEEDDSDYVEATAATPTTPMPLPKLQKLIEKHKMALTVNFRTSQMDGGNMLFKVSTVLKSKFP